MNTHSPAFSSVRLIFNKLTFSRTALLTLLCAGLVSACTPKDPKQTLIESLGSNVILPLHETFVIDTAQLMDASKTFCANTNAANYAEVQLKWRKAMASWHGVKIIDFGPITVDNASWKIQFWPDKHNLIHRKISEILANETTIDQAMIHKASVVVQGLSALELLLFDQQDGQLEHYNSAQANPRRCLLVEAIAEHTHQVAETLNNAWQPNSGNYLKTLTQPDLENSDFKDKADSLGALVEALINGTEVVKRDQLGRPLGHKAKGDRARPYLSEAWRSRASTESVQASLAAIQFLYAPKENYGIDDYLKENGHSELAEKINLQFTVVNQLSADIPPLFDAVSDKTEQAKVTELHKQVNNLLQMFGTALPGALGVSLGFNANDGD